MNNKLGNLTRVPAYTGFFHQVCYYWLLLQNEVIFIYSNYDLTKRPNKVATGIELSLL